MLLFVEILFAQAPQGINYQAVIRNSSGAVLVSTNVTLRMSILQGTSSGTVAYAEKHSVSTNATGAVNVVIGQGTILSGTFSNINWANGPYFIETAYDVNNSGAYTVLGTQQLMSVPYALYAANSGTPGPTGPQGPQGIQGEQGPQGIQGPVGNGFQNGTINGQMLYWNGSGWITINPGAYGQTLSFCNGIPTWGPCLPILTTSLVSNNLPSKAVSGGFISNDGGASIISRGIVWNTSSSPTIFLNTKTEDGIGIGSFSSTLIGLLPNTTYYIRAYATNSVGTSYGNEISFTTPNSIQVGSIYQGGIVAYILQSGDIGYVEGQIHGIIAASNDQSIGAEWGCSGYAINGADATTIGNGNQNTIDIVNSCATANTAARICYNLVLNGYSDWFLPSIDELGKLYQNRSIVGEFSNSNYWSSSEASVWVYPYHAWFFNFSNGSANNSNYYLTDPVKPSLFRVRAVRSF